MPQSPTDDKSTLVLLMAYQAITWTNVDLHLCRHMVSLGHNEFTHCLSHWSLNKMKFSNVFSWIKTNSISIQIWDVCSQGSNGQWVIICSGNGLSPNRRKAITWTNDDKFLWLSHLHISPLYAHNSNGKSLQLSSRQFFNVAIANLHQIWIEIYNTIWYQASCKLFCILKRKVR